MLLPLPQVWLESLGKNFRTKDEPWVSTHNGIYLLQSYTTILFDYYHFTDNNIFYPYKENPYFEGAARSLEEFLDNNQDLINHEKRKFTIFYSKGKKDIELIQWQWNSRKALRPIPLEWRKNYIRVKLVEWTKDGINEAWRSSVWPQHYADSYLYQ